MANKIGCSAGKTILIDPNTFDGQSSETNISVPLEDLSIYAQLETTKRARTVLNSNGTSNTGVSSKPVTIRFIEGTDVGGKKVLTTNYTDLTTSFDADSTTNNSETLGITSIDIDFNSSYAPMVTINFVDLRGSSIFQNEAAIAGGRNKYAAFFQLPYPIYTLTIKGYYGMPVKYDLHMTKFSAKFNSQTGNFEITASFIGYTYAMLSDMLLGYLKAIPYTEIGKAKYDNLRKEQPNLMTLDELMEKISKINDATEKLKSSDEDVALLNSGEEKQDILTTISANIVNLGRDVDNKTDLAEYMFIVPKKNSDKEIASAKDTYDKNVSTNIDKFNAQNKVTITNSDFISANIPFYQGLTIELLTPSDDLPTDQARLKKLREIFSVNPIIKNSDVELQKARVDLLAFAKRYGITSSSSFEVYDLRNLYKILNDKSTAISENLKLLRKTLGTKLKNEVEKTLGLNPSVRNIVSIFTASVEALMATLFEVAKTALTGEKDIRIAQLKKFAPDKSPDSFDIKSDTMSTTVSNTTGPLQPIYYPWPEYRVNDAVEGLVETYLGDPGVLDVPRDVTELRFIDDLLNAFLTSKKKTDDAALAAEQVGSNWYPVSPLDTRLFIDNEPFFPYTRLKKTAKNDITSYMMIRAFTYLGMSNGAMTPDEIKAIATAESAAVLDEIKDDYSLMALTQLKDTDFYNAKSSNDGNDFPIMKFIDESGSNGIVGYYYNYLFGIPSPNTGFDTATQTDAETLHVLQINNPLSGDIVNDIPSIVQKANNGSYFLTNYKSSEVYDSFGNLITKPFDGGIYIKTISPSIYDGSAKKPLPTTPSATNSVLDLTELKKGQLDFNNDPSSAGFDQFGGNYGIQEFRILNFNESPIDKAPFMSMFYQTDGFDGNFGDQLVKSSGFALKRESGASTDYDISGTTGVYQIAETKTITHGNAFDKVIGTMHSTEVHKLYGKNRQLSADYIVNKNKQISFPYVFFQVAVNTDDSNGGPTGVSDDSTPVSLFGSRFYYEQQSEYAKAFLFLHTLPWNGLVMNWKDKGDNSVSPTNPLGSSSTNGIFNVHEILNTFGNRAGFISAPRLWVAFIGGLLWRYDTSAPLVDASGVQYSGGSGPTDPILWDNGTEAFIPTWNGPLSISPTSPPNRDQYLTSNHDNDYQDAPMIFASDITSLSVFNDYRNIEKLILSMPQQAKDEFKKVFFEFVLKKDTTTSDWQTLKAQSEVYSGPSSGWVTAFNNIMTPNSSGGGLEYVANGVSNSYLHTSYVRTQLNAVNDDKQVFDDYIIFTPYFGETDFKYNYFAELRDDSAAVKTLLTLTTEEIIIANMSPKIWQKELNLNLTSRPFKDRQGIYISQDTLKLYVDTILEKLKPAQGASIADKKKQAEQEIFGTDNENLIKFQLYRTCKNIYDKWIGGTTDESNLIFRGGQISRNGLDKELAIKAGRTNPAFIDSFRFVNRSFSDIGDMMIINPSPVGDYLRNNPNASFYDSVTSLLSSNNFDFIALPTYINYGDPDTLSSIFKPLPTYQNLDTFSDGVVGPAFVCVYVGQTSKHLDFKDSEYKSDGVTFECDSNGGLLPTNAKDFTNSAATYENKVAVFAVNYSQQNQNIFKDITIDQNEFSETAESLQITDEIASKGGENRKTFGGQNMYNVYSVRSYKVGVEMMGNAMVQPMMYFQLNNIPMFHGAYMITHVTHHLKPNTMSTSFNGVRIRDVETKLMDFTEMFMSVLDSIDTSSVPQTNKVFGDTGSTNVVAGGVVNNTNNNYATGCRAPGTDFRNLPYYTKENAGAPITSTKVSFSDLANYLNKTNLSVAEKRAVYSVAVLEQGKPSTQSFNAFGNNLFGFNVEGNFPGTSQAVNQGSIINTFCYGDSETVRVFPQFSQWSDSVNLFSQNIVNPRFIKASRVDGYWKSVTPSLNFYQNGIKDSDTIELQALKFTVLYFMEWNSPAYKVDVVNSIGSPTSPTYGIYTDPTTKTKRNTKHVYDVYKLACTIFN